jgi:uncharacterized protein YjbI with pentapeptide repeats
VAVVLLGVLVLALVAFVLKWAPEWLAADDLSGTDQAEEIGRVRTALLATLAGLIAIIGAVFTGLSYRLNQAGQITERFTRAIDQIGSRELDVRLGGIYALERIARDSGDDHPQVVEVLTAFVREHTREPSNSTGRSHPAKVARGDLAALDHKVEAIHALERIARGDEAPDAEAAGESPVSEGLAEQPPPSCDVQAAMSVLGRRDRSRDRPEVELNLVGTRLSGVVLRGDQAHLERAQLSCSHLEDAILVGAHLEGAMLADAHLTDAYLNEAHLERALLIGAHLDNAWMNRAHLTNASLNLAHLAGSLLTGADLAGADLDRADLGGAPLDGANLEGAQLTGARLDGAMLDGANLRNAVLSGASLDGAQYTADTAWPEGFDPDAAGAVRLEPLL